jgi:amino acid transporter
MGSKQPAVFVRDATGLVKNVSLLDAVSLNVCDMGGVQTLAIIGYTMVLLPTVAGVNLIYASIIALALSIPQMIVYTMMTQRMPRTGGDYVWISRTFGGFVGSVATLMGFTLADIPYLSLLCLTAVFSVGSVALVEGYGSFISLALPPNVSGSNPIFQFLLAGGILTVLVIINLVRPKIAYKLVSVLTIIGIITAGIGVFALVSAGNGGVATYINSLAIPNMTYASIASSYTGPAFNLGSTLQMVPFYITLGYAFMTAAPAVGSEIKGKNSLKWNVPISLLLEFVLMTGGVAAMYYAAGYNFVNAALANSNLVYNYSFNFFTLAMGVSSSGLAWVIGIGWIAWIIAVMGYGVIIIPRYFLAQAFDRYLPSVIAYVSPTYGSPVVALLIDYVIAMGFIGSAIFLYGTITSLYGTFVAIMGYFVIVGMAAVVYGAKKEKGRSKIVLMTSGLLMAIVFAWMTYIYLAFPLIWGGNTLAYVYDLIAAILAIAIYVVSKRYHMRQGIDISLAFKEIPPE